METSVGLLYSGFPGVFRANSRIVRAKWQPDRMPPTGTEYAPHEKPDLGAISFQTWLSRATAIES